MSRIAPGFTACLVLLLASTAPGVACGISAEFCPQGGSPAPIVIPPIVMQQIETASAPIALPAAPPPASDEAPAATQAVPYDGEGGLASIADLDRGIDAWAYIAPGEGFDRLPQRGVTRVGTILPAGRRRPLPPQTEVQIGAHLAMEVPVTLPQKGVPGLDQPTLGSGNRALWFASLSKN